MMRNFQIVYRMENNAVCLYCITAHGEQPIGRVLCPTDGNYEANFELGRSIANCMRRRMNYGRRR